MDVLVAILIVTGATYGVLFLLSLPFKKRQPRPATPPRPPSLSQKVAVELARFEERKRLIALLPLHQEELDAAIEEEAVKLSLRVKEVLDE